MIQPSGIHFLLTYRCLLSCDHCFVWGDPGADLVFSRESLREVLEQVQALDSVEWIYFEGGEPFLYPPLLQHGIELAARAGYRVGIVSNGYWATTAEDAIEWLRPLSGLVDDLSVSSDLFHGETRVSEQARNAQAAAEVLGIPSALIICETEAGSTPSAEQGDPVESGGIMYRGRAAQALAAAAPGQTWDRFTECPYELLDDPGRVHIDPLGEVHLCQGLSMGNVFVKPLAELCSEYDPSTHPVVSSLLQGGPAQLVRDFELPVLDRYADACHLCYQSRLALRRRFPQVLTPGYMYGEMMP